MLRCIRFLRFLRPVLCFDRYFLLLFFCFRDITARHCVYARVTIEYNLCHSLVPLVMYRSSGRVRSRTKGPRQPHFWGAPPKNGGGGGIMMVKIPLNRGITYSDIFCQLVSLYWGIWAKWTFILWISSWKNEILIFFKGLTSGFEVVIYMSKLKGGDPKCSFLRAPGDSVMPLVNKTFKWCWRKPRTHNKWNNWS